MQQFKVGAGISVGGFSIGGSYANEFEGKLTGVNTAAGTFGRSEEGQSYDAGVSYSTGPWGVGVTYFHGEWEADPGGGDDETDAIVGGVSYALGPGITASASVLYGVFENEDDGTSFAGDEGKATMGIVGLSVKF